MRTNMSLRYRAGCARKVRVLERQARLSHLALPEMLRLFFVRGVFSYRDELGATEGYLDRRPVTVSVAAGRMTRQDCFAPAQRLRQLRDLRRDPPCLILADWP